MFLQCMLRFLMSVIFRLFRIRMFYSKRRRFNLEVLMMIAVVAGLIIWIILGGTMSIGKDSMVRDKVHNAELVTTEALDVPQNDTTLMIRLLSMKLKELKDIGMLRNIGPMPTCTSNEPVFARCKDPTCEHELPPRLSAPNLESILEPVKRVGLENIIAAIKHFKVPTSGAKYVFLTAASSNHFGESNEAIESLHKHVFPFLDNYEFFYYDLGLEEDQRDLVRSHSGAVLRDFPFQHLPRRFTKLSCYIWKPLIIMAHLESAEVIVWLDSSIRFKKDIRPLLKNVSHTGVLVGNNGLHFPQHVHKDMFIYFGDSACQFAEHEEIDANFILFHNEPFTRKLVLEPLSACALDPNCMCSPENSRNTLSCSPFIRKYSKCHRFDQAALGYIIIKLFQRDKASFILHGESYHNVERGYTVGNYLQKKKREQDAKG